MQYSATALAFLALLSAALATSVGVYDNTCSGTPLFNLDVQTGTCYRIVTPGSCDTAPACANTTLYDGLSWNAAFDALGCSGVTSFLIEPDSTSRLYSSVDCSGPNQSGALSNPCLSPVGMCGATNWDSSSFTASSIGAAAALPSIL